MSTIGIPFTFSTAGQEDTLYGFSYTTMKPSASESADTDAFLIDGITSGSLYYNSGSVAAKHYVKVLPGSLTSTVAGLQLRITGVFINGVKVSGSDSNVYWKPDDGNSSVGPTFTTIIGGVNSNNAGVTPAVTVRAIDNVDGTFDNGNDTVSGLNTQASVNLAAVNDAPVNTVPGAQSPAEDTPFAFAGNISVSDVNDTSHGGVDNIRTTVSVANGTLTTAGGAAVIVGDGSGSVQITGTAAQVNFALNGLSYLSTLNYSGADNLNVLTTDLGNTGTGGALTDNDNIALTVTAVNDAPVNMYAGIPIVGAVPGSTDASRVIVFSTANGNAFAISDVDAGSGLVYVSVYDNSSDPYSGSFALNGAAAAAFLANAGHTITYSTGNGSSPTSEVELVGTVANINTVLQGLTYTAPVGFTSNPIYIYTNDNGNTGAPGAMGDGYDLAVNVVPSLPQILSETVPANGWYVAGQNLTFTVTFDQVMTVNTGGGTPEIAVTLSGSPGVVQALYTGGTGTNTLTFQYLVAATNLDIDGIVLAAGINLNGGTILNGAAQAAASYNFVALPSTAGVSVDADPPVAPTIAGTVTTDTGASNVDNVTSDTTIAVTGTTEANATIKLYDGVTQVGTVAADGAGNYTVTSSALSAVAATGDVHSLTTTATDVAGNTGPASAAVSVTVDTTAPGAGVLSAVVTTDTGVSAVDRITSDTTITVTGTTDANAAVILYDGVTNVGSTNADGAGAFTVTSSALSGSSGGVAHSLTTTSTDLAGNAGVASNAVVVTVDTSALSPSLSTTIVTDTFGTGIGTAVDRVTSDTTIQVTGTAEANAAVDLYVDAVLNASTVANGSGNYTITSTALSAVAATGDAHSLTTVQTDVAGNVSLSSATVGVTVDTTAPGAPTISNVITTDTGPSAADNYTSDTTVAVTGTAEANSLVTLYDGATPVGTTTAVGGNYTITSSVLSAPGAHTLTTIAGDLAGNVSGSSAAVTPNVTVDLTPTGAPTASLSAASDTAGLSLTDGVTSINTPTVHVVFDNAGTPFVSAVAGDILSITIGVTTTNYTLLAGDIVAGFYDLASGMLLDGTYSASAHLTDLAGNISANSAAFTIVVDTIPPTPVYESANYQVDYYNWAASSTLTITGSNIGSALQLQSPQHIVNGTTDVSAMLDFTKLTWDNGGGGIGDTGDFSGYVVAAYVLDNNTLQVVLGNSVPIAPWMNSDSGTNGNGVADTITVVNGFTSDIAGNLATNDGGNSSSPMDLMGNNNEPQQPHVFVVDLSGVSGQTVYDDSTGAPAVLINGGGTDYVPIDNNSFSNHGSVTRDTVHVTGVSAAGVSVYSNVGYDNTGGGGSAYLGLVQSSHFDGHDTGNAAYTELVVTQTSSQFNGYSYGNHNFDDVVSNGPMENSQGVVQNSMGFENTNGYLQFDDGSLLLIHVDGGNETLTGGAHNDQLIADWSSSDHLVGNAGNDLLIGGNGNNSIYGGSGSDVIFGWGGNDFMSGGAGSDTFVVYTGNDNYNGVISGRDTISDFTAGAGGDKIDIANATVASLVSFDGSNHAIAGLNLVQSGSDTLLILDGFSSVRLMGVTLTDLTTANFENVQFNLGNGGTI
jgi:hypothetical protein